MRFIYQEHSLKPGIYKIVNTHTNRIYVGQAKEFKARWNAHKRSLLNDKHQNKFLLNDFKKCKEELGHDDFLEFHVLEVMENSTKEERNNREEKLIAQHWDKQDLCYNFKKKTEGKERSCYSKTPEETRAKKSAKSKEMWSSPEFKESTRKAIRNGVMKSEVRKLRSQRMKETWNNLEHREKVVAHRFRPEIKKQFLETCFTPKAIEKNRQARKRFYGKIKSPTGEIFEVWSLSEFCKVHCLGTHNISNLSKLFKGSHQQICGWTLVTEQ